MKKMLGAIILIIVLFGIYAELEKMTTSDGSTPATEQLITETVDGVSRLFEQIKDGISTVFTSVADYFKQDETASSEIGEVSVDQLPEDAQEYYHRYESENWETETQDLEGKTKAGEKYRNKSKALPSESGDGNRITYEEFDAETTLKGNRGEKRFVHGSDGSTYYTDDHYKTFRKVIK